MLLIWGRKKFSSALWGLQLDLRIKLIEEKHTGFIDDLYMHGRRHKKMRT